MTLFQQNEGAMEQSFHLLVTQASESSRQACLRHQRDELVHLRLERDLKAVEPMICQIHKNFDSDQKIVIHLRSAIADSYICIANPDLCQKISKFITLITVQYYAPLRN